MSVGFATYFRKGIEASQDAENNFNSIRELLNRLTHEIRDESGNTIELCVADDIGDESETFYNGYSKVLQDNFLPTEEDDLPSSDLIVKPASANFSRAKFLAELNFTISGLPCRVSRHPFSFDCQTIDELESAIGETLADPDVGRVIYVMMKEQSSIVDSDPESN